MSAKDIPNSDSLTEIANRTFNEIAGVPSLILILLSMFFGAGVGVVLADFLFSFQAVKKYLSASSYVDGYWHIKTHCKAGEKTALSNDGILHIITDPRTDETKVTTTRYIKGDDSKEHVCDTFSEVAYTRYGNHVIYLNYFTLMKMGDRAEVGLSTGTFISTESNGIPNRLWAIVFLTGDNAGVRTQYADKIGEIDVKKLKKKYPNNWQKEVLKSGSVQSALEQT